MLESEVINLGHCKVMRRRGAFDCDILGLSTPADSCGFVTKFSCCGI